MYALLWIHTSVCMHFMRARSRWRRLLTFGYGIRRPSAPYRLAAHDWTCDRAPIAIEKQPFSSCVLFRRASLRHLTPARESSVLCARFCEKLKIKQASLLYGTTHMRSHFAPKIGVRFSRASKRVTRGSSSQCVKRSHAGIVRAGRISLRGDVPRPLFVCVLKKGIRTLTVETVVFGFFRRRAEAVAPNVSDR